MLLSFILFKFNTNNLTRIYIFSYFKIVLKSVSTPPSLLTVGYINGEGEY